MIDRSGRGRPLGLVDSRVGMFVQTRDTVRQMAIMHVLLLKLMIFIGWYVLNFHLSEARFRFMVWGALPLFLGVVSEVHWCCSIEGNF
jgi:hypothetical protein